MKRMWVLFLLYFGLAVCASWIEVLAADTTVIPGTSRQTTAKFTNTSPSSESAQTTLSSVSGSTPGDPSGSTPGGPPDSTVEEQTGSTGPPTEESTSSSTTTTITPASTSTVTVPLTTTAATSTVTVPLTTTAATSTVTVPLTTFPPDDCPANVTLTNDTVRFFYEGDPDDFYSWACEKYIDVSDGLSLLLTMEVDNSQVGSNALFIDDMAYGRGVQRLYTYRNTTDGDNFYLGTYSTFIRITVNYTEPNSTVDIAIPYQVVTAEMLTTLLTNHSGMIDSEGDSDDPTVNYQHVWNIVVEEGSFVVIFVKELNLNYANGDFVTIGPGETPFEDAPSIMLASSRKQYPAIEVASNEAYVYLFSKDYNSDCDFKFYYNITGYTEPTFEPPTTLPPSSVLNTTIEFDENSEDFATVMESFSNALLDYVALYCNNSDVFVNITEAVDIDPCMVLVFEIGIINGTCNGDGVFTLQDYNDLMGNYSEEIEDEFGRSTSGLDSVNGQQEWATGRFTLMTSCPYDVTVWVVSIVVILVVSLIIIAFVAGNRSKANLEHAVRLRRQTVFQQDTITVMYSGDTVNPLCGEEEKVRYVDRTRKNSAMVQRSQSVLTDLELFHSGPYGDHPEETDSEDEVMESQFIERHRRGSQGLPIPVEAYNQLSLSPTSSWRPADRSSMASSANSRPFDGSSMASSSTWRQADRSSMASSVNSTLFERSSRTSSMNQGPFDRPSLSSANLSAFESSSFASPANLGPQRKVSYNPMVNFVFPNQQQPNEFEMADMMVEENEYDTVQEMAIQKQALNDASRNGGYSQV